MNYRRMTFSVLVILLMLAVAWSPPLCEGQGSGPQLISDGEKLLQDFKFLEAEKKLKEAMSVFQDAGDKAGMALCFEKLGGLACDLGNYGSAVQVYNEALSLYAALGHKDAQARVLSATGIAYDDWGDFPGAIYFYEEGLRLDPSPAERARIESRLATIYMLLGDQDECVNHLKAGLVAARDGSDSKQLGAVLLQLGDVYEKTGLAEQARAAYEEALGMKDRTDVATQAQIRLGNLSLAAEDFTEAKSHYQTAKYDIGLGRVSNAENKYDEALKHFQIALAEGEGLGLPSQVFAARAGMGLVHMGQHRNTDAEENLRGAVQALEEVRDLLPVGKRMHFLSDSSHGFKHMATYEAFLIVLTLQGKDAEAFKIAEYTRSRVLTEGLSCKTALAEDTSESLQSSAAAEGANKKASQVAIETLPFGALHDYFKGPPVPRGAGLYEILRGRVPSYHDAAISSLLMRAALQDFGKPESTEADTKGADYCRKAGFDSMSRDLVKKKIKELQQRGLQNHLTCFVPAEGEKK